MTATLLAWIGATDLKAAAGETVGVGPIANALDSMVFDRVHILSNYRAAEDSGFIKWIAKRTSARIAIERVTLTSPTDYEEIYNAACATCERASGKGVEFTFHLSPGTPAMAAVWILLAKSRFPARLIESSPRHGVKRVKIPFEIAMEFVPQLLAEQDARLRTQSAAHPPPAPEFADIIHRGREMSRLIGRASRVALHNVPVLIEGESGTGKELLARAIHRASPRRERKLLAVNCGAIPRDLVESELFGHQKGAFTGATAARAGYFEDAHGGTLFLDEVGELPLAAQVKLLRVLQDGEVVRVGANRPVSVDVRIIAATNRTLSDEVSAGTFREDLFFRLAVAVLKVPPLRERTGDLGLLIDRLFVTVSTEEARAGTTPPRTLSAGARSVLLGHPWPGNVRELLNTLRRMVIWADGPAIAADDAREALLPLHRDREAETLGKALGDGFELPALLDSVARHYLTRAMKEANGNKTRAADLVGLPSYQTLSNWLQRYGVAT
ncbi:MAG: Anaerobic nitric oxide reductase transcription regulator NorR [Gemmatimonadaceae bacterium]|nr:Anaerobic nitric oxide reductase transcription regulator NorR [Gemmatimonadaceae bacterium]